MARFNGELSVVMREHIRATVEGFLSQVGALAEDPPLRVWLSPSSLRVEGSLPPPARNGSKPPRVKGHGLDVVDRLADRWGFVADEPSGFWFEIDRG